MDEMWTMLIIIKAIHLFCKNSEDCENCPFHLNFDGSRYCMFADKTFPEDWDISRLEKELKEGDNNGR